MISLMFARMKMTKQVNMNQLHLRKMNILMTCLKSLTIIKLKAQEPQLVLRSLELGTRREISKPQFTKKLHKLKKLLKRD